MRRRLVDMQRATTGLIRRLSSSTKMIRRAARNHVGAHCWARSPNDDRDGGAGATGTRSPGTLPEGAVPAPVVAAASATRVPLRKGTAHLWAGRTEGGAIPPPPVPNDAGWDAGCGLTAGPPAKGVGSTA